MILEVQNLIKEYVRGSISFRAVDDVSLKINKGDFVCIFGRSGSGKSTLLNLLVGLLTPTSGNVRFEGKDYRTLSDKDSSLLRNTKLGYIMQGQSVLPNLTVLQNVLLPVTFFKRDEDLKSRALELLDKVGLFHLASQYPANLSGGEMRRIAIVRALLTSPELLIADEPTGDLDEETTREIMKLFASVAEEGAAVLMVTHDVGTMCFAKRFYTMKSGLLEEM